MAYLDYIFHAYLFLHRPVSGKRKASFWPVKAFSENAHNAETEWYILIKFCILISCNIVETLVCKTFSDLYR